mmetsp:Transcript_43339/g.123574  ORF Transcript_43339/g.123574 Transcript_43339/m.123574 type:complete len:260 (-) Transcript_43339:830-1609(-)
MALDLDVLLLKSLPNLRVHVGHLRLLPRLDPRNILIRLFIQDLVVLLVIDHLFKLDVRVLLCLLSLAKLGHHGDDPHKLTHWHGLHVAGDVAVLVQGRARGLGPDQAHVHGVFDAFTFGIALRVLIKFLSEGIMERGNQNTIIVRAHQAIEGGHDPCVSGEKMHEVATHHIQIVSKRVIRIEHHITNNPIFVRKTPAVLRRHARICRGVHAQVLRFGFDHAAKIDDTHHRLRAFVLVLVVDPQGHVVFLQVVMDEACVC